MAALTFCGASVRGYNTNMGWNGNVSQLKISVVEDPDNGDFFNPPSPLTPIFFQHQGFKFFGLLQKWVRSNDTNGLPTYDIDCVDPREILEGAQLITGGYRGTVTVHNLYNVFGWCENNLGFGNSLSNDSGMPAFKVIQALNSIMAVLNGPYGSKLNYKGVRYGLDLTELPVPPAYYRVPTPSISLLEFITTICDDAGYDYFIELLAYNIKIRTVNRKNVAPLGTISALQGVGYGTDLMRSSAGLEGRNEVTSAFCVGGQQENLWLTGEDAIQAFWGFDIDGNPILGVGEGLEHNMNLNAAEVADIVGDVTYLCTVHEMVAALASQESWKAYISTFRTDVADAVGINSVYGNTGQLNLVFGDDNKKDDLETVKLFNKAFLGELTAINTDRLFNFVHNYASQYLGKKFAVAIPFTLTATDPQTLQPIFSQEVCEGGYLPENAEPLGLPVLIQDQFKTGDGKFVGFCLFKNLTNIDANSVIGAGDDMFIGDDGLYLKVQIDKNIIFTPAPAVVVTLNNPIYELPIDPLGDISLVSGIWGITVNNAKNIMKSIAGGNAGNVRIHPLPHQPDYVAVPLRSNILTYGPWFAQGAPGKVKFDYDPSLNPWQFGGYEVMNLAGNAKVEQAITFLQLVETGDKEYVGAPNHSLGDVLQLGGPNITGIDVSYGERGLTTRYRMTTFTPKFGQGGFTKDTEKRLERYGRTSAELRKNLRAAINKNIVNTQVVSSAYSGWLSNMSSYMKRESPHTTLIATIQKETSGTGILTGKTRSAVSSATFEEIVAGCGGNNDSVWQNTAVMSMNGLLRPFAMSGSTSGDFPKYATPKYDSAPEIIDSNSYNPFQDNNDINCFAWEDNYQGMNAYRREQSIDKARLIGLRAPLVLTGFGITTEYKFVPGDGSGNPGDAYVEDYLKKSHLWKTGPQDLLWDENRGVWTSHDLLSGSTEEDILPGGSGAVTIDGIGYTLLVYNFSVNSSATVPGGKNVICGYAVNVNKWFIVAADC